MTQLEVNAKSYFSENALTSDRLKCNFSYFNLLANPDDRVSLRYLLGYGASDFRTKSYARILRYAKSNRLSVKETLEKLLNHNITIPYSKSCTDAYSRIKNNIKQMQDALANDRTSLIELLSTDEIDDADFRKILIDAIEDIEKTENQVGEFSLNDWLKKVYDYTIEKISYPANVEFPDHVRIMSLHSSKGLSAKFVVVMSCIDGLIPYFDSSKDTTMEEQLEEQRRLFYVAITRCKSSEHDFSGKLIISSFVGLPGEQALQFGLRGIAGGWSSVSASRFISDFDGTAPTTIIPSRLL